MDSSKNRSRIYIIDDSQLFLKLYSNSLSRFDVTAFLDPAEALEMIISDPPDIVLTDLEMPILPGIELVKKVRKNKKTKNLPMIICTSRDDEDTFKAAFEAGANDFINKNDSSAFILNVRVQNLLDAELGRSYLVQLAEEKNLFLRMLCHDLANPLTISMAYGKSILKKIDIPEQEEKYLKMLKGLDKMNEIISYTREHFSLIDEKKEIELASVELNYILKELFFLVADKLKEKSIDLRIEKPMYDIDFICEKDTIVNQVFANLFTNAIKFSHDQGRILFNINVHDDYVCFCLKDNGIGIPDDLMEKLFDVGAKTSRTGTGGEVGTGYGLPLVKTFVERCGGSLKVESHCITDFPDDHWTKFTVEFPIGDVLSRRKCG